MNFRGMYDRKIWIIASYIASKENVDADAASRVNSIDTEWELSQIAFNRIIKNLDQLQLIYLRLE